MVPTQQDPIPRLVQVLRKGLVVAVVRLQSMGGAGASQYNLMMAGTMLAMLPMLILFLLMNRMFVEAITQGAIKG